MHSFFNTMLSKNAVTMPFGIGAFRVSPYSCGSHSLFYGAHMVGESNETIIHLFINQFNSL